MRAQVPGMVEETEVPGPAVHGPLPRDPAGEESDHSAGGSGHPVKISIRHRITGFTSSFDEGFRADGIRSGFLRIRTSRATAFVERSVGTVHRAP